MLESLDKKGVLTGDEIGALEGVAGVALDTSALDGIGI
jgi:hypothetical protein